jgi:PAS domain-containing protein
MALLTAGSLCGLAAYIWRHRATDAGGSFTLLLVSVAVWVLAAGLDHVTVDLGTKVLLSKLCWLGIVAVPPSTLVVALHASGRPPRPLHIALLVPVPCVLLALVATNEHHGLIWASAELETSTMYPDLRLLHGPAFWVGVVYHYGLLVAAAVLLLRRYVRHWREDLGEAFLVALALAAPWVANVAYLLREGSESSPDLTPYAFSITAVCLAAALWQGRGLMRVLHVARSEIIDEISDSALVIDARGRLIYANAAARRALDLPEFTSPQRLEELVWIDRDLLCLLREDDLSRSRDGLDQLRRPYHEPHRRAPRRDRLQAQ